MLVEERFRKTMGGMVPTKNNKNVVVTDNWEKRIPGVNVSNLSRKTINKPKEPTRAPKENGRQFLVKEMINTPESSINK